MRFLSFITFILFITHDLYSMEFQEGIYELSRNNLELNSAINELESAKFQQRSAYSGYFPKISASLGTIYGTNSTRTDSMALSASENLFAGFSDSSKINQAQYNRDGVEANLVSIKAKISFDYKSAYVNLLYVQKYIALANEILKRREANLRLVQLRFESGRENIGSLNLSKAYLAQAKYDHLVATNSLSVAQAQLGKVLGRNIEDDRLVVTSNIPLASPSTFLAVLNYKNLANSAPAYQKAIADEMIAKEYVNQAKSSFFPTINLTQTVGKTKRETGTWSDTWSVGAELTLPLFNGGKDYFSYKSLHETYRAAVHVKRNSYDVNLIKLKDAFTKYVELVQKVEVDSLFVEAGVSRERIAKEKYNNGLLTFDEWDIIENDLIARQKTLIQTEKERVVAEALWEQVQGKGVLK